MSLRSQHLLRRQRIVTLSLATLLCGAPALAGARPRVAEILGKVRKIRVDLPDDARTQVFITERGQVAAVLRAIGLKQRPDGSPPDRRKWFELNLNFFGPDGMARAVLGFYGGVGAPNRLSTLGFSVQNHGAIKLANAAALKKIVRRCAAKKQR